MPQSHVSLIELGHRFRFHRVVGTADSFADIAVLTDECHCTFSQNSGAPLPTSTLVSNTLDGSDHFVTY